MYNTLFIPEFKDEIRSDSSDLAFLLAREKEITLNVPFIICKSGIFKRVVYSSDNGNTKLELLDCNKFDFGCVSVIDQKILNKNNYEYTVILKNHRKEEKKLILNRNLDSLSEYQKCYSIIDKLNILIKISDSGLDITQLSEERVANVPQLSFLDSYALYVIDEIISSLKLNVIQKQISRPRRDNLFLEIVIINNVHKNQHIYDIFNKICKQVTQCSYFYDGSFYYEYSSTYAYTCVTNDLTEIQEKEIINEVSKEILKNLSYYFEINKYIFSALTEFNEDKSLDSSARAHRAIY
jgi:hypothetical protein